MDAMIANTVAETLVDLRSESTRELNGALHRGVDGSRWRVAHPEGRHNLAVGLSAELQVHIDGHVGYFCAGMNQRADVVIEGNAGVGVAENMMSGSVRVRGNASQSAGATAHGGLLVIEGNAGARCGISLKGADIVVGGDVGHVSAFMAQAGRLVVCGDAGDALGDSIYETQIFVRGRVKSLGADCVAKPMRAQHLTELAGLLAAAGVPADPAEFTRYGSARTLYNYHVDDARQEHRP